AELFRPLLLFVIGMVLLFTLEDVEPTFLLPVTWSDMPAILKGLPLAAEAVSVALVIMGFLAKYTAPDGERHSLIPWLLGVTVLNVLLCAVSVGSLGKTYTSALAYPFFIIARDLSVFSGVERIEALVVGLWLLPDFILITLELIIAADNWKEIFSLKQRKLSMIAAAACALLIAFRIAPNGQNMSRWSDEIIPAIHLAWAYGVVPLLLLIGGLRKKF
ncbi:MAG: GerAB/ArcD/ProY family transporter, partial [Oscillospiraceae bacterium]|nr:GerAB/ArcD/ProY family transporter [Oscillospiraceae bacterium]